MRRSRLSPQQEGSQGRSGDLAGDPAPGPAQGNLVEGLTARESAALEALAEAGVEDAMAKTSIGRYDYRKTELKGGGCCRVAVFPMEVRRVKRKWPERDLWRRKWMTFQQAAVAVDEGDLKKLIARFAKTLD